MQYYEALGLEPKLALDLEDLQKRFYERSRQWHPDRFSRASPDERQKALDMTALLNDSFRTLRVPAARAEYLLKQSGLELSKEVPPELLDEVFELNMLLDVFRNGPGDNGESVRTQLDALREVFVGMRDEIDGSLAELSAQYDEGLALETLERVRDTLSRRRYIANLVRDVDKELNVHLSN